MVNYEELEAICDADSLVFSTVAKLEEKYEIINFETNELVTTYSSDLNIAKHMFDAKFKKLEAKIGKKIQLFISGKDNFRYDIYPEYKANRKGGRTPLYLNELKQYTVEKYNAIESHGAEADDYVSFLKVKYPNTLLMAIDKDVLYNTPGKHYNYWQEKYITVTPKYARWHFYMQTITGDTGDNIIGCPQIGPKRAVKFIGEPEENRTEEELWQGVIDAYKSKDLLPGLALLNARCINMHQYNPITKELNLWE